MTERAPTADEPLDCELCIIGAGYAALNGLNAAAKYLKPGARVVVVDKNENWGGQWLHQYDFVRLHQPYRMFTAGDQRWTLDRDRSHLATRREVLDHLATVPAISAGQLDLQPLFGHAYTGHVIRDGRAELEAVPVANGKTVRIRARRLLKATGAEIEMLPPFPLSSTRVRSVGVSDPVLMTAEFLDSEAPVYLIGSGKTAMDTARHVLTASRSRRAVNVLTGSGMWFLVRDNLYPNGYRRYVGGTLAMDLFMRVCTLFDGENDDAVTATLEREGLLMNVFGHAGNWRGGALSFTERDEIRAGVSGIFPGYLVDVNGTRMIWREGMQERETEVQEGSWFVNCTSHYKARPHEPVLQDGGVVCAPQSVIGLSGPSAYVVTHLWFCDQLPKVAPEFFRARLDVEPKARLLSHLALLLIANTSIATPLLPLKASTRYEGDFNRWYPLYRQVPTTVRFMTSRSRVIGKAERLLKMRFSDPPDPA